MNGLWGRNIITPTKFMALAVLANKVTDPSISRVFDDLTDRGNVLAN